MKLWIYVVVIVLVLAILSEGKKKRKIVKRKKIQRHALRQQPDWWKQTKYYTISSSNTQYTIEDVNDGKIKRVLHSVEVSTLSYPDGVYLIFACDEFNFKNTSKCK